MDSFLDAEALKEWFNEEKRELPWRKNPSPYRVWISEVMLQQTQASVVEGYFERWMERFPTISALASATLDEVLKCWEGLGYYSRARNLHQAARDLVENHGGELPASEEHLKKIKGLGPYTIGAILGFAFHQKAAAVDGNVARVMTRYFLIEEDISKTATQKIIRGKTHAFLPEEEPWVAMEALIELGAQICKRTPLCSSCPLNGSCLGYINGRAAFLPIKKKEKAVTALTRFVAIIEAGDQVLLKKGEKGKVMADLYEFPYFEVDDRRALKAKLRQALGLDVLFQKKLPKTQHTFTRYKAVLYPSLWSSREKPFIEGYEWVSWSILKSLPFSSGHRRILIELNLERSDAYIAH